MKIYYNGCKSFLIYLLDKDVDKHGNVVELLMCK